MFLLLVCLVSPFIIIILFVRFEFQSVSQSWKHKQSRRTKGRELQRVKFSLLKKTTKEEIKNKLKFLVFCDWFFDTIPFTWRSRWYFWVCKIIFWFDLIKDSFFFHCFSIQKHPLLYFFYSLFKLFNGFQLSN